MRPEDYREKVRPDGTASYYEINPEAPALSSRDRGWDGIVVEREHFYPFDNGEVAYDEIFISIVERRSISMLHRSDGRGYEGVYAAGDLVLSPAGQPVRWRLDDEVDGLTLILHPSLLEQVASEATTIDPMKIRLIDQPKARDPVIQQVASALLAEVQGRALGERLYAESLANVLALHLLRHYSTLPRRPDRPLERGLTGPKLHRAIDAIHASLESGISLAQIAEAAGVSPSHFATLFKRSTGLAPHQYLIRCRIERVKGLLGGGDDTLSLGQIAAQAGFCDQGHMTRHFKRLVGVTPARFRELS